ncbi:MAG: hypothetical protein WCA77_09465 [Thermoplasmata archaeon]
MGPYFLPTLRRMGIPVVTMKALSLALWIAPWIAPWAMGHPRQRSNV